MYGKRTPEDGKIDWNQPIENIYNLIRAVSHPYPGAFTFLGRSKILIWESKIIPKNSNNLYKNGQVIDVSSISFKVKCNSGILEITKYNILDFKINVNDFLN
jgi:methionyl-tRNA formyltransferase